MLSNYPQVLKYAIGDRPWMLSDNYYVSTEGYTSLPANNGWSCGNLKRVMITGWRTEVSSVGDLGVTAIQENYYIVKEILRYDNWVPGGIDWVEIYDFVEFEVPESKLSSSRNHLLSVIKGNYINSALEGLTENGSTIFKNMGRAGSDQIISDAVSNGDWIDWAGWDFRGVNFIVQGDPVEINYLWTGEAGAKTAYIGELGQTKTLIVDNCNFEGCTMPTTIDTKAKLRTQSFSYDETTTIWTDGTALGRV